ncbi:hypothetical protein K439DRAFT_1616489 [Ramaria rubella]|nr:hypothetical protein K439DRAFT_1616489 [Ramaria rubella]
MEVEKECFEEIDLRIKQLDGTENASKLPVNMQDFLKSKAQAWQDAKSTAHRASTRAVVQDARITLQQISDELMALSACTDMETFLFAVKGKPEHSMPSYVACSAKGEQFLVHGIKKTTGDIVKDFETYVLTNLQGLTLHHNSHLAKLKRKIHQEIHQGLIDITNDAKAMMQFDRTCELANDVPFINASEIGSAHTLKRLLTALTHDDVEKWCHWVNLSTEEWEKRKIAYYDAQALLAPKMRKRKACTSWESESEARSSESENSDAEVEERPKKKSRKAKGTSKENNAMAGGKQRAASSGVHKGAVRTPAEKGKGTGKGRAKKNKDGPLAPITSN